jgi:poly(A) polymerase
MFSRAIHIGHGFQRRGRTLKGTLENILERGNSPMVAARLCAENDFILEPKLEALLREMVAHGRTLSHEYPALEAVRSELSALLLAPDPARGIEVMHQLGLLERYLPELAACTGLEQFGGFHHLDVLEHSIEALRRLVIVFPDASLETRWAALLHDVGKPASKTWDVVRERWSFFGHDQQGAEITRTILSRLGYDAHLVERAAGMVDRHMQRLPGDERQARRFVSRHRAILPELLQVMHADREAARGPLADEVSRRDYQQGMDRVLEAMKVHDTAKPLMDGQAIMAFLKLEPGPMVGSALEFLREAEANGDASDLETAQRLLEAWAKAREIGRP